jgi:hypothetical protein
LTDPDLSGGCERHADASDLGLVYCERNFLPHR